MRTSVIGKTLSAATMLSVAACGGGGGTMSTPAPVAGAPTPAPAPAPTPTPTGVLPPATIGLTTGQPYRALAVSGTFTGNGNFTQEEKLEAVTPPRRDSATVRYLPAENVYEIDLPDLDAGRFVTTGLNGSGGQQASSVYGRLDLPSQPNANVTVFMPTTSGRDYSYRYSHWGSWSRPTVQGDGVTPAVVRGLFVYGVPASQLPASGSASYKAEVHGSFSPDLYGLGVAGDARLTFDFTSGALTGLMHPISTGNGFYPDAAERDFGYYGISTSFNRSDGSFSGQFILPAGTSGASGFEGLLTGPGAAEVIATWTAPYNLAGTVGTLSGILIGKKD